MKTIKYISLALFLTILFPASMSAKRVSKTVYMFGFSASFKDSVVFFTEVQPVDSAWIETKSQFLQGREQYSYQLRNYLADSHQMPGRVCVVIFSTKKAAVEKQYAKMRRKYTEKAKGVYDVRYLHEGDFRFQPVDMRPEE